MAFLVSVVTIPINLVISMLTNMELDTSDTFVMADGVFQDAAKNRAIRTSAEIFHELHFQHSRMQFLHKLLVLLGRSAHNSCANFVRHHASTLR